MVVAKNRTPGTGHKYARKRSEFPGYYIKDSLEFCAI